MTDIFSASRCIDPKLAAKTVNTQSLNDIDEDASDESIELFNQLIILFNRRCQVSLYQVICRTYSCFHLIFSRTQSRILPQRFIYPRWI